MYITWIRFVFEKIKLYWVYFLIYFRRDIFSVVEYFIHFYKCFIAKMDLIWLNHSLLVDVTFSLLQKMHKSPCTCPPSTHADFSLGPIYGKLISRIWGSVFKSRSIILYPHVKHLLLPYGHNSTTLDFVLFYFYQFYAIKCLFSLILHFTDSY